MARRGQRILPVFMTQLLSTRGNFFFNPLHEPLVSFSEHVMLLQEPLVSL